MSDGMTEFEANRLRAAVGVSRNALCDAVNVVRKIQGDEEDRLDRGKMWSLKQIEWSCLDAYRALDKAALLADEMAEDAGF